MAAASPGASPRPWPSLCMRSSAPSCSPSLGSTSRRCKLHLMLRAVDLLPFLRGIRRFSTLGHPNALDACYVAAWPLPRPDLHRLADDSLPGHTTPWLGGDLWLYTHADLIRS